MTDTSATPPLDPEDPAKDDAELASRWAAELADAEKEMKEWHKRGDQIVARYLDDRDGDRKSRSLQRLNLYTANTNTMEALLFGKTPDVGVDRRFADSMDDVARVASEMLERLLNADVEDEEQEALRNALKDRLNPGFGTSRLRYEMGETEMGEAQAAQTDPESGVELAPAVPAPELRPNEKAALDYVFWKDEMWSPCRVYADVRWRAWRARMSKAQLIKRFGKKKALQVAATTEAANDNKESDGEVKFREYLQRSDVWEIWSKEDRTVYWVSPGYPGLLDKQEDPLGLKGFWPSPRPMFANLSTSKLLPTPDFALAQDLYDEIDDMATRAMRLEQAIKVRFVYDKNNEELKRLVSQVDSEEGIGVDSWAAFSDKGKLEGAISWLPIDMIVKALEVLNEQMDRKIAMLYQITGMSDIMRGQASEQTTATEQAIKARFASVRVQTLQDEFARYASDAQRIKAEIIARHFDPQTIIDRSNIMRTPDQQFAQQAVELIKSDFYQWRISVDPDSVSLTDFAALKQERFEFAQTLSSYFQSMIPFVEMLAAGPPGAAQAAVKFIIDLAQTMVAGLKGSNEMEGIFDQFVAQLEQAAQQPPQPPPPDPKLATEQVKAQAAQTKAGAEQFKAKADVVKTGMEMQQSALEHKQSMEQAKVDHSLGIQSAEAKERELSLKAVNSVTEKGKT